MKTFKLVIAGGGSTIPPAIVNEPAGAEGSLQAE